MNTYKILHIINRLSEASFLFDWASMLHKRHWNVAVLPVEDNFNQVQPESFDVPVIKINGHRRGAPRVIWEIGQRIHQHKVRLIHVHQNYSGCMASLAVLFNNHVHVVNTEHNSHSGLKRLGLMLNSASLLRANYHCFNSNNTMNSLKTWEKRIIRNTPKKVIYNGVPIRKIEDERKFKDNTYYKWKLCKDKFYIGKIALLEKQKDHNTLLRAIRLLAKNHSEIKLLLMGDGSLCKTLKYQVKKLGITAYVDFMGLLKRRGVYQLLHILDVSVMTSRWEGFCNAIVESMAAGLPIVVSDIPTLKETVGDSGLFFCKGNHIDLAAKLEKLITSKETREKYAKLAKKRCLKLYNIENAISQYEKVYESLLEKQI